MNVAWPPQPCLVLLLYFTLKMYRIFRTSFVYSRPAKENPRTMATKNTSSVRVPRRAEGIRIALALASIQHRTNQGLVVTTCTSVDELNPTFSVSVVIYVFTVIRLFSVGICFWGENGYIVSYRCMHILDLCFVVRYQLTISNRYRGPRVVLTIAVPTKTLSPALYQSPLEHLPFSLSTISTRYQIGTLSEA